MKRNRNGFKILLKERSCSLSNYTMGALLYGVSPYVRSARPNAPDTQNVRGVLRHCVPNKGLRSLAPLCGYPLKTKRVTKKVTRFA